MGRFDAGVLLDRATTVTDNQVALGLFYRGLFPSSGETLGIPAACRARTMSASSG